MPQGSILEPLLFIIFFNHLPSYLVNKSKMFADDLKIHLRIRCDSEDSMAADLGSCQRDIEMLHRVALSWGLNFNVGKCVTLRFCRGVGGLGGLGSVVQYNMGGCDLLVGDSSKDLGVLVDSSLRFHAHVSQVVSKAWALANNLLRSTLCRSSDFMCGVYIAHIRPLLEYSSPVWNTGFVGDSRLLESVLRRWTKHIESMENVDYKDRLSIFNMYSVKGRLLRADLLKYFKIFSGLSVLSPSDLFVLSPSVGTRGHRFKILKHHASLESRRRFFSVRCIDIWNSLPDVLVGCGSVDQFKSGLHFVLGDRLFEFDD